MGHKQETTAGGPAVLHRLRPFLVHLRLHFQLILAPIFLWGVVLAMSTGAGRLDFTFWLAFVALHVFLYGGTTAFNSYYDRDEGPVGGLAHPPPVFPGLLPFSLAVQSIGFVLAAFVNPLFLLIYLLSFVVATAYSHPAVRLKRRPLASLAAVGLGQGGVVTLAGWVTVYPDLNAITPAGGWGILATTLMLTGIYPVTQIYQIDEDLARGDLTFAAWLGPRQTLRFAVIVQGMAAGLLVWVMAGVMGWLPALLVGVFYTGTLLFLLYWSVTFDDQALYANYRRVMRLTLVTSSGFLLLLSLHLLGAMG